MKKLMLILFVVVCAGLGYYYVMASNSTAYAVNPKNYGSECQFAGACGELTAINCKAEVDGPFYYVNNTDGEIVSHCGGYCMGNDCTGKCPPKEWTCH